MISETYPQRSPPPVLGYLVTFALALGLFVFAGLTELGSLYFGVAYIALLFAFLSAIRRTRDGLNLLSIILLVGFIRFSIPALMISLDIERDIPVFEIMGARDQDWTLGHALALMGLLGVTTGWLLELKVPSAVLRRIDALTDWHYSALPLAAISCMLIGFIALLTYVGSNIALETAVVTGEFRETEIQVGTGKYLYLAFLLSAGSLVFTTYLVEKRYSPWIIILPALFSMVSFSVLGGRVMAFVPLAAAGVILWYRSFAVNASMRFWLLMSIALLPVYFFVAIMYRGGLGIAGVGQTFSVSSLVSYMKYALWIDWGNLHAMAAAVMIGPGALEGRTFSALLWPLSEYLGLGGKSAGVFMVQELLPGSIVERKWGFHATLIGDAYLNFGLVGVLVVTIIFGIALEILYRQIRTNVSNTAVYALAAVYSLRLFFESIEKFPEAMIVLVYAMLVAQLGRALTLPTVGKKYPVSKTVTGNGDALSAGRPF